MEKSRMRAAIGLLTIIGLLSAQQQQQQAPPAGQGQQPPAPAQAPPTQPPATAPATTPGAPVSPAAGALGGLNFFNVSLTEVIDILAQKLRINYILDPR